MSNDIIAQVETHANEEAWLEARRNSIGASESPAILGLSPWQSSLSIWANKIGIDEPITDETGRLEAGHRMESLIADWYGELSCRDAKLYAPYTIWTHPEDQWLTCTLDGGQTDGDGYASIVEIKTSSDYAADEWRTKPPLYYQFQCQHQMLVTGAQMCTLVAMIGFHRPVYWDIMPDRRIQRIIREKMKSWWHMYVVGNTAPTADDKKVSAEILKRMYPKTHQIAMRLGSEEQDDYDRLIEISTIKKELEREKLGIKNRITQLLGECSHGELPDGRAFSLVGKTRQLRRAKQVPRGVEYAK
jgi:putative phage-type endonuclease